MEELKKEVKEHDELIHQKDIMIKNLKTITDTTIKRCDEIETEKKEIERVMKIQEQIMNNQEQELMTRTNYFKKNITDLETYKRLSTQDKAQITDLTNHIGDIKSSVSWRIGYFLTRLLLPFYFLRPKRNKNK